MSKKINLSEIKRLIIQEIKTIREQKGLNTKIVGDVLTGLTKFFGTKGDEVSSVSKKIRDLRKARKARNRRGKKLKPDLIKKRKEKFAEIEKNLITDDFFEVLQVAQRSPGLKTFGADTIKQFRELKKFLDEVVEDIENYKAFTPGPGGRVPKRSVENARKNLKRIRDAIDNAERMTPTRDRYPATAKLVGDVPDGAPRLKPTDAEIDELVDEVADLKVATNVADDAVDGANVAIPKLNDTVEKIKINFDDAAYKKFEKKLVAAVGITTGAAATALLAGGDANKATAAFKDAADDNETPETPTDTSTDTEDPETPTDTSTDTEDPQPPTPTPAPAPPSPSSKIPIINELKKFLEVEGGPKFIRFSLVRVHNLLSQDVRKKVSKDNPRDPGNSIPISDSEARKIVSEFIEMSKPGLVGMDAKDLVVRGEHSKKAKDIVDFYEDVLLNPESAVNTLEEVAQSAQYSIDEKKIKAIIESSIRTVVFGNRQRMGDTKAPGGQSSGAARRLKVLSKGFGLGAGGKKVRLKPLNIPEENKSYNLDFSKWSKLWN
mgnify:FL=1|tara:strand:+ start:2255 stop:3898 length:1644 start_codon:yes stop_codon:yes gene_type:complete